MRTQRPGGLKNLHKVLSGGGESELRSVSKARDSTSFRCSYDFDFHLEKLDLRTFSSAESVKGECGRDGAWRGGRSILKAYTLCAQKVLSTNPIPGPCPRPTRKRFIPTVHCVGSHPPQGLKSSAGGTAAWGQNGAAFGGRRTRRKASNSDARSAQAPASRPRDLSCRRWAGPRPAPPPAPR